MGVYKRVLYQKHGSPVAKNGVDPDHFGLIMRGVDKGQGSDIMTAFRRNEDAGGAERLRGRKSDPWNLM